MALVGQDLAVPIAILVAWIALNDWTNCPERLVSYNKLLTVGTMVPTYMLSALVREDKQCSDRQLHHHFEFPLKTMSSLHAALKPGGRVFLVDFERVEGESSEWTMKHVRAGQEVFEAEILSCGFKKVREHSNLLKENYFIEFERVEPTK